MTDSQDPYANPPGWTDPYADLNDLSGDEPLQPMEPPTTPPAQPPGSPLLTGLIIGLLLIALSVAVFQLLSPSDTDEAGSTTTTTADDGSQTTTSADGTTSTSSGETTTSVAAGEPFDPVPPPIEVDRLKLITNGMRVNDNDIKDMVFGDDAATVVGRLVASLGEPTEDTDWQVSTGQYGVCAGDLERVVFFGPYAAIVTKPGGQEIYSGYRFDLSYADDLSHVATGLETLSGLTIGDTVEQLMTIYGGEDVVFSPDPKLGEKYEVTGSTSGNLLLWGPVEGEDPTDRVIGIYAPDVCST